MPRGNGLPTHSPPGADVTAAHSQGCPLLEGRDGMNGFDSDLIRPLRMAENSFLEVLLTRFRLRRRGEGTELLVAFDEETHFPRRIRFHPDASTLLSTLVGSDPVTVEYADVRLRAPESESFSFTPSDDVRVFRESSVPAEDLAAALPFEFSIDTLFARGYRSTGSGATLVVDAPGERSYGSLVLVRTDEDARRALTLRFGNYLSRNMGRRRAALAERGEPVEIGSCEGRLLDRGAEWAQEVPAEGERELVEVSWTEGDRFFFLLGDGVPREELLGLAAALLSRGDGSGEPPSGG